MFPLTDSGPKTSFPFWVIVIIAINIYVFYLELTAPNPDAFITQYALVPAMVDFFNLSTLFPFITSQFLHGGFIHIISNLWFLWIFGDNVEDRFGRFFFPVFYLAAGTTGNFLQYIVNSTEPAPIIGASGAIAGVLGAYYAFFPGNKIKTLVFILFFITIVEIPASFILFYWFITQLFSSAIAVSTAATPLDGIAYFAHIGGFVLGWLLGKIISLRQAQVRA